jgi:curli biogenesis system outer membrane secretion channel CsgG
MKYLLSIVLASSMAVALPACAKEEAKPAVAAAAAPAAAKPADKVEAKEPETKKVCIKVKDAKTGKEVEKCRTMKVHEKHEGTKVPDEKKK